MSNPIYLKGCRQHNLKNITLTIQKNRTTVFTGVSGSGKSSLAFDTLYAEGQRRYLEYLSSQARTWVKQMPKPDVDFIEGLSPTLAVGQRKGVLFSRGTVATYTDIYDFISLLYARIGEQHSPITGKKLERHSRQEIIHLILKEYPTGAKIQLLAPIKLKRENPEEAILRLQQMGFVRLKIEGEEWTTDLPLPSLESTTSIDVVIDRLELKEGIRERLAPSIETALDLSQGILKVQEGRQGVIRYFTEVYVCPETSYSFSPLEPVDFNFNSPRGACPICLGRGGKEIIQPFEEWIECPSCRGACLKPESLACLINEMNIEQLCRQTVSQVIATLKGWHFTDRSAPIAQEILPNIITRLQFLEQVGLGYLELNRAGKTLSDGEANRIQLASQIGAKLSGIVYILDEPSLGLHRQDTLYLSQAIEELKSIGNTLILVEHEPSLIARADHIIELGPGAGIHGGSITFQGSYCQMLEDKNSLTGQWLSGHKKFPKPPKRSPPLEKLKVKGASLHHINKLSVDLPLGCLVGLCGVSGSGKSTLALDIIGERIHRHLSEGTLPLNLEGYEPIHRVVLGEKRASNSSSRSIPATYVGLMTPLRLLFAETRLSKARGYTAARFSLNKRGGRCEACGGTGEVHINMQLMPDLLIPCDVCLGERYNYETLQVTWENHTIAEVLSLSIDAAAALFRYIPPLAPTLSMMQELGLGYLTLGQSFATLSGGEVQRLRLVGDLAAKTQEPTLYILDEPSAGLHFEDIEKLMMTLHRLVDKGHSIFFIEHHLELLKQADWLVELGPGGGPHGGKVIFEGTPQQMKKAKTPTGRVF